MDTNDQLIAALIGAAKKLGEAIGKNGTATTELTTAVETASLKVSDRMSQLSETEEPHNIKATDIAKFWWNRKVHRLLSHFGGLDIEEDCGG